MKHTPGPWRVDPDSPEFVESEPTGVQIAYINGPDDFPCLTPDEISTVETELAANARLMAAAPDLLEAAEAMIVWFDAEDNNGKDRPHFGELIRLMQRGETLTRAAIDKARGKGERCT